MTWYNANSWVSGLHLAGGGWRMPKRGELKRLYQKGKGSRNMTPLLKTAGWYVWTGEEKDSSSAWRFDFYDGNEDWRSIGLTYDTRAFAVRSRR